MGVHICLLSSMLCACIAVTSAAPTPPEPKSDMDMAVDYLMKYEYLGEKSANPEIREMMDTNMDMATQMALTMFQENFHHYGVEISGKVCDKTKELMMMKRCGVKDVSKMGDMMKRRKKRYLLRGGAWQNTHLTYRIDQYPRDNDLTPEQVDREIKKAFQVWERVSPLRFTVLQDTRKEPDIVIEFSQTYIDHGDGYPFDGESGTLAHAFYPQGGAIGGDAHFDEAETWTVNTAQGVDLFLTAAHEFGHSLGLGHSGEPEALMAPFYRFIPHDQFELSADDIAGIQAKYPLPITTPRPTDKIVTKPPEPTIKAPAPPTKMPDVMMDVCKEGKLDAITTMLLDGQHQTVAFKGKHYFFLEDNGGILYGYPKLIQDTWPELPTDLDAAVFLDAQFDSEWEFDEENREWILKQIQTKPANTLFFKGEDFWLMEDGKIGSEYPKNAVYELGFPSDIDAVFKWMVNGAVYIFKGDQYYRYTEGMGIEPGYPRSSSAWGNLPSKLDTVFQHKTGNGTTVFFAGNQYYLYNDERYEVEEGYPQETEPRWLQCDRHSSAVVSTASYLTLFIALIIHLFISS